MPDLSIIVPTFNEIGNVAEVAARVATALRGIDWELIFVDDDSPDGTAQRVRELARTEPRVRCLHRIGRRGLASACMEGMLASSAPLVAVMDGDLQHDERLLPAMLQALQTDPQLDIVVGSRYVQGGATGAWDASREKMSRLATRLSAAVLRADLQDPMSGFFMIRHATALRCIRAGMSGGGLQDPARSVRELARAAAISGTALRVSQPFHRSEQARHYRRLGIPHHAAGPLPGWHPAHSLHRLCPGGRGGGADTHGRPRHPVQGFRTFFLWRRRLAQPWWR